MRVTTILSVSLFLSHYIFGDVCCRSPEEEGRKVWTEYLTIVIMQVYWYLVGRGPIPVWRCFFQQLVSHVLFLPCQIIELHTPWIPYLSVEAPTTTPPPPACPSPLAGGWPATPWQRAGHSMLAGRQSKGWCWWEESSAPALVRWYHGIVGNKGSHLSLCNIILSEYHSRDWAKVFKF